MVANEHQENLQHALTAQSAEKGALEQAEAALEVRQTGEKSACGLTDLIGVLTKSLLFV